MYSALIHNPIMQNKLILATAYVTPKLGHILKERHLDAEHPSLLDYGTRLCQKMESKGIEYLGTKKWEYLVNVYGENFWIAMIGILLLTQTDCHSVRQDFDVTFRTYLLAFTAFPPIAYALRKALHRIIPLGATHLANFIQS